MVKRKIDPFTDLVPKGGIFLTHSQMFIPDDFGAKGSATRPIRIIIPVSHVPRFWENDCFFSAKCFSESMFWEHPPSGKNPSSRSIWDFPFWDPSRRRCGGSRWGDGTGCGCGGCGHLQNAEKRWKKQDFLHQGRLKRTAISIKIHFIGLIWLNSTETPRFQNSVWKFYKKVTPLFWQHNLVNDLLKWLTSVAMDRFLELLTNTSSPPTVLVVVVLVEVDVLVLVVVVVVDSATTLVSEAGTQSLQLPRFQDFKPRNLLNL